jgi:hypothetical protein
MAASTAGTGNRGKVTGLQGVGRGRRGQLRSGIFKALIQKIAKLQRTMTEPVGFAKRAIQVAAPIVCADDVATT